MPEKVTLHYKDGTTADMDSIDARRALRDHPSEWSAAPFPKDYVKEQSKKVDAENAETEAKREAEAAEVKRLADEKAAKEQAEQDIQAKRVAEQQEEKRKADEAARDNRLSAPVAEPPITNDGLKVGHIPSEVPALEAPVGPFEAREKGRGWWAIYDSKGTQVGGGIREADGKSFNELNDEDKQEYVNSELAKG